VAKNPCHEPVGHAAEHTRPLDDVFALAELRVVCAHLDHVTAEAADRHREAGARAQAGLGHDDRQVQAEQWFAGVAVVVLEGPGELE